MALTARPVPLPVRPFTGSVTATYGFPRATPAPVVPKFTSGGPVAVSGPIGYRPPVANPVQVTSRSSPTIAPTPIGVPQHALRGLFA